MQPKKEEGDYGAHGYGKQENGQKEYGGKKQEGGYETEGGRGYGEKPSKDSNEGLITI